jgi:N-methylhydantoinase B
MNNLSTTAKSKPSSSATETDGPKLDAFTMTVLRRRFEAIIREMVNALFKSGRSGVLNTAMDFSCNLTDAKFQSISLAVGVPVHVGAIELIPKAVASKFGDNIHPGDCFANNSGYMGNTHCADFTLCVPVFFEEQLVFYAIARAHFADIGFPTPTTYSPTSVDMYAEGLTLPCVRIQKDYRDEESVIDICRANIRVPEQFYGDYLACVAAVRTAERRLIELCEKYGAALLVNFVDQFQDYAERMAIDAISKLPAGSFSGTVIYDSEVDDYPDGIPVNATIRVAPDAGMIEVDLTDNVDNLPLGINLTEATVTGTCRLAVLNILGPDIPRCTGAFRRLDIKLRDGAAIGRPIEPAATSAATTNLCPTIGSHVQALFAKLTDGLGTAYGSMGLPGSCPVVSGRDPRSDDKPFVNQIMMGYWGGPGGADTDGWLTYGSASSQGMLWQSSVEMVEHQQPLMVEEMSIRQDSGGAGQWEGAPGAYTVFKAHCTPVRFTVNAGAHDNPPPGVAGGHAGAPTRIYKLDLDGNRIDLGISIDVTLQPGEKLLSYGCGGGGFGDPAKRDRERVRERIQEGWLSSTAARERYGVAIVNDAGRT